MPGVDIALFIGWSGEIIMAEDVQAEIAILKAENKEQSKKLDRILKILEGNGEVGLVTRVMLNKSSITRIWWTISGVSVFFGGIIAFCSLLVKASGV